MLQDSPTAKKKLIRKKLLKSIFSGFRSASYIDNYVSSVSGILSHQFVIRTPFMRTIHQPGVSRKYENSKLQQEMILTCKINSFVVMEDADDDVLDQK